MLMRVFLIAVVLMGWHGATQAAPGCAGATEVVKSGGEPIVDWYDTYIRPYRYLPADKAAQRLTKPQVEAFTETLGAFNRRAALDQMELEGLVSQITRSYARAPDFKGIDTAAVEKIYKSDSGQKLDFSLFCVSPKSLRTPDDAFSVTLFGVIADDCQHIGIRGLVFTAALVNGSPNGQCKPDQYFTKMYIWPLPAGTNEVTFICARDTGGCMR
jgi:hypothetical protein